VGEPIASAERFPTGLAHYVYDVVLASGRSLVIRLYRTGEDEDCASAIYWSNLLRPMGVPLPALLHAGTRAGMPYLILERFPGRDLGLVYDTLRLEQKRAIAAEVVRIQRVVATLPEGQGFGFVPRCHGPFRHRSWSEVIQASLARSRARIEKAGVVSADPVSRVERSAERFAPYFSRIRPTAFLDDTTTKNVIVHEGRVSGLVDVDLICFGDPLFPISLTRTALVNAGHDQDYVDSWCELLALGPEQHAALCFYTALFCADFLGELGHSFNREDPIPVDASRLQRLLGLLDEQLARM
jgi:aminoglycoside phosphotransferase (APT) family kinase protein